MSIHYIKNSNGAITSVRAVAAKVDGKQIRQSFSVKKLGGIKNAEKAAEKWATEKASQVERGKHVILDVPNRLMEEILECLELLQPYGKRLPDVVREYVSRPELQIQPWTVSEAGTAFIASRRVSGKREYYLRGLERVFKLFGKEFGARLLDDISTEELEKWLEERKRPKKSLSPVTFGYYRRYLRLLWNFARARHRCSHDPVKPIVIPTIQKDAVKILTIDQTKALLFSASEPARTYLAVQAFTGVRPFEVLELGKNSIDDCYNFLSIKGLHAKSRKRRLVTVPKNLAAWLRKANSLGQVTNYWKLRTLMKNASLSANVRLTQDVLRHSYASYHLALHQNAAMTANEMGHHNQRMLFEHYRELVTPDQGQAYFGINPP